MLGVFPVDAADIGFSLAFETFHLMKTKCKVLLVVLPFLSLPAVADNSTLDAAIGGGLGGAVGGAVGNELGGRDGAIIGAGVGAAAGAAISTSENGESKHESGSRKSRPDVRVEYDRYPARRSFCPPGQAKKGRC